GPAGPCGPDAPGGPAGPIGPCAPVAPVSPFGPAGPWGPVGPTVTPPDNVARCIVALCVKFALPPEMVMLVPVGLKATVLSAVSVSTADWPAVTEAGLKLAVTPEGRL